jgi:prevent-host-death family protein
MDWQLQDAKARLSEVVKLAQSDGPQVITVRGRPAAVLVSYRDYLRLKGRKPSFVEFVRISPLAGADLSVKRDWSLARRSLLQNATHATGGS